MLKNPPGRTPLALQESQSLNSQRIIRMELITHEYPKLRVMTSPAIGTGKLSCADLSGLDRQPLQG